MRFNINELKESNDFLNTLIDNITSAVFIADKDLKVQNINNAFKSLFYKPEDAVLGELFGNAVSCLFTIEEGKNCGNTTNCDKCKIRKSLINVLIKKVPTYKEEIVRNFYINNKNIEKYFMVTTKYINYNNEEMGLVIVDDITEFEKQKLQLETLNDLKNKFLGIAAHELRNPLGVIKLNSAFILEELSENITEEQKSLLKIIYKRSEFMADLINNLLDISKIESGKLELKLTKGIYYNFVKNIVELNKFFAYKKQITINLKKDGKIPEIYFDENKIEQVLNNLISNATKYSFPNTTITVEVKLENSYLVTNVFDQGQGIPENELPKIFQEFQTTSVKATAGEKSTGLGLAIAKKIVEGHKGLIGVKSKIGIGSNFYFKLPISTTNN